MNKIRLTVPFPPSLNHMYGHRVLPKRGGKDVVVKFVTKDGKAFASQVAGLCIAAGISGGRLHGDLAIAVDLYPPDRRARDVDNYCKALLDALTMAQVWRDDSQLSRLVVERHDADKGHPRAEVTVMVRQAQGVLG